MARAAPCATPVEEAPSIEYSVGCIAINKVVRAVELIKLLIRVGKLDSQGSAPTKAPHRLIKASDMVCGRFVGNSDLADETDQRAMRLDHGQGIALAVGKQRGPELS